MAEKTEKAYTLKGVQSEITRLKNAVESKKAQIKKLTDEIKSDNKRIKNLEAIHTELYQESLQKQIASAWFKDKSMTPEQIQKFLAVSVQIQDKIDTLGVTDIVNAVTSAYNEHSATSDTTAAVPEETEDGITFDSTAEKVDTNINIYGNGHN